jgi:hypothetical protein
MEGTSVSPQLHRRQRATASLTAFGAVLAAAALAFAAPTAAQVKRSDSPSQNAALSQGFSAAAGKVRCAVHLPHQTGLLCAATGIRHLQYDGRGVVELQPSGEVSLVPSGSDRLLEIDGNGDGTYRPALASRHTWNRDGFTCTNRTGAVTCRRAGHGFTVSGTSYRRF